jgi:hypothetical protein
VIWQHRRSDLYQDTIAREISASTSAAQLLLRERFLQLHAAAQFLEDAVLQNGFADH